MSNNSESIKVPAELWSVPDVKVCKVILRGPDAHDLPYDVFINALKDHGIFQNNDTTGVQVNISSTARKRTVFGKLKFAHRQTFEIEYKKTNITFLLIDPSDKRLEITLLHMPYQTTPGAIQYIFTNLNKNWHVSDIKHAPGDQMRNDRWQLSLDCDNKELIPHTFILPNMGVEGEDLKIKVRVRGRKPPCYICDDITHSPEQCPDKRRPPRSHVPPVPRPRRPPPRHNTRMSLTHPRPIRS